MKQFYTSRNIAAFAPSFFLLCAGGKGELYLMRAMFHYGMLSHDLISAVSECRPDVVRFLLKYRPPVLQETLNWMGVVAARKGYLDVVRQLPVTIHALEAAVFEGHRDVVEYMMNQNPALEREDMMETACQGGHLEMVLLLLDRGQDISDEAMCAAVGFSHLELLQVLLQRRPCPLSAIYRAVRCGHLDIAAFLLPQFTDELNFLLITAVCTNHLNIVQLLIEAGAGTGSELSWLISHARERGFEQSAVYLENAGLDVSRG